MSIDREFLVAGLTGILVEGGAVDRYLDKYPLSEAERQRAASIAIKCFMQGGPREGREAVKRVNVLACHFDITPDQLKELALEVLRGAIGEQVECREIAWHVLTYFLENLVPSGKSFGFTGIVDSFDCANEALQTLLHDLCYADKGEEEDYYSRLPEELNTLLKDVEACIHVKV